MRAGKQEKRSDERDGDGDSDGICNGDISMASMTMAAPATASVLLN